MPQGWMGVVHRRQVEAGRQEGFVAFSHGRKALAEKLSVGDGVVYYAPRADLSGAPVQAFVALATVTGEAPEQRYVPVRDAALWVRAAEYEDVGEVPVRPLLDRLSFTRGRASWGMAFRGGLKALPEADFALIAAAMREAAP